jgi:hypothetical protein
MADVTIAIKNFTASYTTQLQPADAYFEMNQSVRALTEEMTNLWWSCSGDFPPFKTVYSPKEQIVNEKKLDEMTKGMVHELKRMPLPGREREAWQEHLRPGLVEFAKSILHIQDRQLEFIESSGMIAASREFGRMARRFAPCISAEDIYQAGRNVMTATFIQLLLGYPVEVTPSIFGYSMLYPYTDNYLDDPAISYQTKKAFNTRFERCLKGEKITPENAYEQEICKLVGMIESQWDRDQFPEVYTSLLAIHRAQVRSLSLVAPGASPYQKDVLGISFEKGGTSVLADGYLVAGKLTPEQKKYLFGYGAFTQLMDDLEDIDSDRQEGRLTVFTQAAGNWKLDGVTSQFIHFGRELFANGDTFVSENSSSLQDLIRDCLDPILIDIVGQKAEHFSSAYRNQIERCFPFRFSVLKKQRQNLERQKVNLGRLVEAMI